MGDQTPRHHQLSVGELIDDKYTLTGQFRPGSMAEVWTATYAMGECVVKTPHFPGPGVGDIPLKLFPREIDATVSVSHENIVRALDHGKYQGRPYLVMEDLKGGTLAEVLGQVEHWEWDRGVCSLCTCLCEALGAMHEQGWVHRDFDPTNVMLIPRTQAFPKPVIFDFGCARKAGSWPECDELERSAQVVVGRPGFSSPEQVLRTGEVDHRADLWSLGALMFYLGSGEVPYCYMTQEQLDDMRLLARQQFGAQIPSIPDAGVTPEPECLDAEALAFLRKAMAADPGDRFNTAAEMLEQIRHFGQ